jgi:hypothetical protein
MLADTAIFDECQALEARQQLRYLTLVLDTALVGDHAVAHAGLLRDGAQGSDGAIGKPDVHAVERLLAAQSVN